MRKRRAPARLPDLFPEGGVSCLLYAADRRLSEDERRLFAQLGLNRFRRWLAEAKAKLCP